MKAETWGKAPGFFSRVRRCLVTGGLGYAGAWVTSWLAGLGHEVFVLSRRSEKSVVSLAPSPERPGGGEVPYALIQADIAGQDPPELASLLPPALDLVVHAASCNEAFLPDYARKALATNALGTRNLLEALTLRQEEDGGKHPLPLVLYLSTIHVHGRLQGHITEDSPLLPLGDYALTHLFGEEYCRMFMRTKGLPQIVLRLSNGYGAPRTPTSDKWYLLLNDLCRAVLTRGRIELQSDPSFARDFVWLGDVAAVAASLVDRRDLAGRVFIVSSGEARTLGEISLRVAAVAERCGLELAPLADVHAGLKEERPNLHVDNAAICEALSMAFHDRIDEEIRALFAFLRSAGTIRAT